MKFAIIALIPMLLLTACGAGHSKRAPDTQKNRVIIAPDVPVYDKESRFAAIKEIQGGQCTALTEFAKDYKVMRDQSRAIQTMGR